MCWEGVEAAYFSPPRSSLCHRLRGSTGRKTRAANKLDSRKCGSHRPPKALLSVGASASPGGCDLHCRDPPRDSGGSAPRRPPSPGLPGTLTGAAGSWPASPAASILPRFHPPPARLIQPSQGSREQSKQCRHLDFRSPSRWFRSRRLERQTHLRRRCPVPRRHLLLGCQIGCAGNPSGSPTSQPGMG